jgi:nucleoside-diphosphate-sugar epimerase
LDFSIAKAERLLGYRPRVDFREGILPALDYTTGKTVKPQESEAVTAS